MILQGSSKALEWLEQNPTAAKEDLEAKVRGGQGTYYAGPNLCRLWDGSLKAATGVPVAGASQAPFISTQRLLSARIGLFLPTGSRVKKCGGGGGGGVSSGVPKEIQLALMRFRSPIFPRFLFYFVN